MKLSRWSPLLLAIVFSPAVQSADPAADACYRHGTLLDVQASAADREIHLSRLKVAAGRGDAASEHLLGALFRLGPDHPANLLPQDDAQARHWLTKAALSGNFYAMSGLAEMDLAAGKSMDAMVWAQVQALFVHKFPSLYDVKGKEYAADLIFRSYVALTRPVADSASRRKHRVPSQVPRSKAWDDEILKNANAFLGLHGDAIGAALREQAIAKEQPVAYDPACPPLYDSARWPLEYKPNAAGFEAVTSRHAREMRRAGFGLFYLDVAPDGSVSRVLTVDALPGPDYAAGLLGPMEGLRFNAIEGAPTRGALVPVSYSTGAVKFTR
jgi:hypothetical protein